MREKWKQLRKGAGAACICMFVLGIVMVIWPGISVLTACMLLGIFCILGGIYEMVRYFKLGTAGVFFRYDFSSGIFSILAGISCFALFYRGFWVLKLPGSLAKTGWLFS